MLKKDITYNNFNGQPVTEPFYFHLSQAELLRMEVSTKGGLQKALEAMVAAEDGAAIMDFMEKFIKSSVGKKSDDGSRFNKSPEILDDFISSPAYDTLFMELITNPDKAAEFLNGIVPKEMAANVERLTKLERVKASVEERQGKPVNVGEPTEPVSDPAQGGNVFTPQDERVPVPLSAVDGPRQLTEAELDSMDRDEIVAGIRDGRFRI